MPVGITLEQAQQQLDAWLSANLAVSQGQSYSISEGTGSRTLTRANASQIMQQIQYWQNEVSRLTREANKKCKNRVYRVVPMD